MSLINITTKILNSENYNEKKILASDINQIKGALQSGTYDIKPNNIYLEGNTITADSGQNWIRRNGNTFQFYNGSSWQEPSTDTLLTFTAGENIAARDVVYLKVSDGKIYKASTANNDWIGVATAAITSGASGTVYPNGSLVGGFSGLTSGTWYGLNATAGTLTANNNYIVGIAISATQIILVKPKGDMSTRDNALYKLQGEKAINDVSATNSGVLAGSSQVLIDKFLDATGQNNTVDTGAGTTAYYETPNKLYECNFAGTGGAAAQNAEATHGSTIGSDADKRGYLVRCNINCVLVNVTKHANCTATTAYLYDATTNQIATATFSGNVATFASEQKLIAGQDYQILAAVTSGTYTYSYDDTPSYPYNNTYLKFMAGRQDVNQAGACYAYNITKVGVKAIEFSDSIVQSVATTIPTGKTKVFVTPLMYEALATGDNITADVSIDNGAHYTEDVPINEWTPITSANGTQLIVKANLLTGDGSTSPKILGWRVLLE